MFLAREARFIVLVAGIAAAMITYFVGLFWSLPCWLIVAALVFILRDFPRVIPSLPLANVSPVDGKIVEVDTVTDPYLERDALRIRIKQNPLGEFNAHSPIEGKIQQRWFPSADNSPVKNKGAAAQFALWIQTDEQDDVVVAVDLTSVLRYNHCDVQSGDRVGQGQRCGFIGFGCPVEVYLPVNSRAEVEPGQRVQAGSDVIATFVHNH